MNLLYLTVVSDMLNDVNIVSLAVKVIRIVVIIVGINIVRRLAGKIIRDYFNKRDPLDRKSETLVAVIKSTIKYLLYFIGGIMILQELEVDTKSIIAAAGVGGVAIGFGARNLVEDIVSGFFIIFEGQYSIGEHVKLEGYEGIVEEIQLRTTRVRDYDGELHIIPNGKVTVVTNRSRGEIRVEVEIKIAYGQNIEVIKKELEKIADGLLKKEKNIIKSGPHITGVTNLGENDIFVSMYVMAEIEDKSEIEIKMREIILEKFPKNEVRLEDS